jgi:hypothetical protein
MLCAVAELATAIAPTVNKAAKNRLNVRTRPPRQPTQDFGTIQTCGR